jgi:transcriptional regulator with XRE-family HTH domain
MTKAKSSPLYARLREILAEKRQAVGLSQTELAARLGKPQSYVSKVESGERGLDVVEFVKWVRAIDADPARILKLVLQSTI